MTTYRQASDAPKRTRSAQDVQNTPEHLVAEVIDGKLHTHPRPAIPHAIAGSSLGDELVSPFQKGRNGPGGWWIIDEPELHFGEDILVPDIGGWRRERMPVPPDATFTTLPPDWVCEILSPSTRAIDLHKKRPIYAREGVGYLWLLDPDERTLEAFELHQGEWVPIARLQGNDQVSVPPFDSITFNLGNLWIPENTVHEPSPKRGASVDAA